MTLNRFAFSGVILLVLASCAFAAPDAHAKMLLLTPSETGAYTLVPEPTREKASQAKDAGKLPLVVTHELFDEKPAFVNYADCASAVAFDLMPRRHLVHSWKDMEVKLLQTVAFDPEGSADAFRRACGFMAFAARADGVWLTVDEAKLPPSWRQALDEAREDWRILLYLQQLSELAAKSKKGLVRTEHRRVTYWFGWMPADWENLDVLRLESVGYARRLEQLLKLPAADLPTTRAKPIEPQTLPFMPYGDWAEKPEQIKLGNPFAGKCSANLGGGLSFSANPGGFSVTWSTTNASIKGWTSPGKFLDFSIYLPGEKPGDWLPYHFHCDLDPQWYASRRAPAVGRDGFLFGIDERFRYGSIAYGVGYSRVSTRPKAREYGPDYPMPRPGGGGWSGNRNGPGGSVTVSFGWSAFLGHWPMLRKGKFDLWYVGLDRSPETGKPIAARLLWPRGHEDNYMAFASRIGTGTMTDFYKGELARVADMWSTADAESRYMYAPTEKPAFHRYDLETDHVFYKDVVKPLLDANENGWQLFWTDKEHKRPKFNKEPDSVRRIIYRTLDKYYYMSYRTSELRAKYLEDRWSGKLPPEYVPPPPPPSLPDEPDVDYDPNEIQLEDKAF